MEQLNISPEPVAAAGPDDEALAKAGEAAVEAGNTHSTGTKPRPDWIPEKFWNPTTGEVNTEGLAKSYAELEKAHSKPEADPKPSATPSIKIETLADAQTLATSKGIDFSALSQEYASNGDLTPETYTSLEAKGIPKDVVRQFVEGQKAQADQQRADVLSEVGGEESYSLMTSWAKANLDAGQITAYNNAMATGDIGIIKLAVSALQGKYSAANGSPPKVQVGGKGTTVESTDPFLSRTQYVDAIKDPRYERDSAYRTQVTQRLAASSIF